MKRNKKYLSLAIFLILVLIAGCASLGKNYRDTTGVLKTDTRSNLGVRK